MLLAERSIFETASDVGGTVRVSAKVSGKLSLRDTAVGIAVARGIEERGSELQMSANLTAYDVDVLAHVQQTTNNATNNV